MDYSGQIKVYKLSKSWKAVISLALLVLSALIILLLASSLYGPKKGNTSLWSICVPLLVLFFCGIASVFKSRIEIHSDKIRRVGLFFSREMPFSAIAGFRTQTTRGASYLFLIPAASQYKQLKIYLNLADNTGFQEWAKSRFANLDELDYQHDMDEALKNSDFGANEDERRQFLQKAKVYAKMMNGAAVVVGFWAFLFPEPYETAMWAVMALPPVVLLLMRYFKGALRINAGPKSPYPGVYIAFVFPCFVLFRRVLTDFNILQWENFWAPFAILSICSYVLLLSVAADVRKNRLIAAAMLVACCGYGYSASISANCLLDDSMPAVYESKVTGKEASSGKHTTYYVTVGPWGQSQGNKVMVDKSTYRKHNPGDRVSVILNTGKFGIPWVVVL